MSFGIRYSGFQSYLAQQASDWLSKEWKTVVRIEKIDITILDHVYIQGLYVEDLDQDTLAYLGHVDLDISALAWSSKKIDVKKLEITNGKIYLIKKLGQEVFNYEFIEDYFATDEPPEKQTVPPPRIAFEQLILNNVDFKYILEYRKEYEHGINFNKLDLRKINLSIANLVIDDENFIGQIAHMSAREKSGFVLDRFSAKFDLNPARLNLTEGKIETSKSAIQIPKLSFLTKTWDNYNYFEDSVYMDIRLSKTIASMEDVAYFATDLWGMNQEVYLSGSIKDHVYNLKINDLHLETGLETILRGNFELPDFRKDYYPIPKQQIAFLQSSYRDLVAFRVPSTNKKTYLPLPTDRQTTQIMKEAGLLTIQRFAIQGRPEKFTIFVDEVASSIGTIRLNDGIEFSRDSSGFLNCQPLGKGVGIENLDLAKISEEKTIGLTSGIVLFQGREISNTDISFEHITGSFEFIEINGIRYKNLDFIDAKVSTSEFSGFVKLNDKHAKIAFDGAIRFDQREEIEGEITIEYLNFEELGFSALEGIQAKGGLLVKTAGFSGNNIQGFVKTENLSLSKDSIFFAFNQFSASIDRSGLKDLLLIDSDVLQGRVEGVLEFDQIALATQNQLSKILPFLVPKVDNEKFEYNDFASFQFTVSDANSLLRVLEPKLFIESGTKLNGSMNGDSKKYQFDLSSPQISYEDYRFTGVQLLNNIDSLGIDARYSVDRLNYNDSLYFDNVLFSSVGTNSSFLSKIVWGEQNYEGGELNWSTKVDNKSNFSVALRACHFFIESERWSLDNFEELNITPMLNFSQGIVEVRDFMFVNGLQYVSVDGKVSDDPNDALQIQISDFDIDIFNKLYINDFQLFGLVSGNFSLHNIMKDIFLEGSMSIDDFKLNDNYIGTVDLESSYDDNANKININGLLYNETISKNKTNTFSGNYMLAKTVDGVKHPDKLDFNFNFATMDVSFANAFVDEKVASDIEGTIEGELLIKGSSEKPLVSGKLALNNGQAKIGILGTKYQVQGPINISNYGLSMVNMPIRDEESNTAILSASVFHDNFNKWDYNVFLDLTRDGHKKDPLNKNIPAKLDRFLALNTYFKEGEVYYGKGYVTGNVNIYGTEDRVDITANLKSARGTQINFPMYGRGDIGADDFVVFINNIDSSQISQVSKIDFTGVRLNLNIEATPDANLSIIFDERTGDEISAAGRGLFRITLDELNDITMSGTFEVVEGAYNFALGVVKKLFKIEPGSTVKWTGDPYEAVLNVKTYYLVEANLQDISALYDRESEMRTNNRDQIYCYLSLKDRLSQPILEFDIGAPRATDAGRLAINRVRSDYDELTRQFFSLLLMRQFQPLRGSQTAANTKGTNALNELLANQINAVLNQISGNYDLRVSKNDDALANQSTYKLGFASSFFDDRLTVSGSFGVSQMRNGASMQGTNPLIGDVNIEYKLNRSGSFRVNVFNRSNQFTVIHQYNIGMFTQGAGIYYQESFSGWHDFQLAQYGLDLFRPQNQRRFSRLNSRYIPIPYFGQVDSTKRQQEYDEIPEKSNEGSTEKEIPDAPKGVAVLEEE